MINHHFRKRRVADGSQYWRVIAPFYILLCHISKLESYNSIPYQIQKAGMVRATRAASKKAEEEKKDDKKPNKKEDKK